MVSNNENYTSKVKDEIIQKYYQKDYSDILKTISIIFGIFVGKNYHVNEYRYNTTKEEVAYFVSRILTKLNIESSISKVSNNFVVEINKNELEKNLLNITNYDINYQSFLSGMFLSSGRIENPNKKYMLEIRKNSEYIKGLTNNIINDIIQNSNLEIKENESMYYITKGDDISEFLQYLQLPKTILDFENIRIDREIKNGINRVVNLEVANMQKSIKAGAEQLNLIKKIRDNNLESKLTKKQLELINFKEKNPDLTVTELANSLNVTKSSITNRFKKIEETINECEIK